ncbi:spaetzle-processing enzyme [Drosophila erecta]|uniref:spaetzle-processing enzyme n=1 Tax=Drosophila erecta TaxID=7220 RepID=UPI000F05F192|nr:spaetzle-processing enzyme [Drosophila erecta]XP_026836539.1 spaetzle-processing enzyme [Drosophila erecta]
MKSLWIVIFAFLICLTEQLRAQFIDPDCGTAIAFPHSYRIKGGRTAHIGSNPWMAYLHINSSLVCAGTLITKRFVLTAAHCMDQYHLLTVRLGEYDTTTRIDCTSEFCIPTYKEYTVEDGQVHIMFKKRLNGRNDIGLLKLNGIVSYTTFIRPVCLFRNPGQVPFTSTYEATGWGNIDLINTATVLQTVSLNRLDQSECAQSLRTFLAYGQFCAGQALVDTCSGDSGGPLLRKMSNGQMTRTVQLGIVSYGHHLCRGPGVYTDVPSFTKWILDIIHQ